jgi:hypothetical protein
MKKKLLKPAVASAVYAFMDTMAKEHWIEPGDYSEDAQRRMVEDANKTIREATDASGGPVNQTGFTAPQQQQRNQGGQARKSREDDEP